MTATASGTFRLIDKASSTLDKIERKAAKLTATLEGTGQKLDGFQRKLNDSTASAAALNTELDKLGRQRITPRVNLQGVSAAVTQIEALNRAKRNLDSNLNDNGKDNGPVGRANKQFGRLSRTLKMVGAGLKGVLTAFPPLVSVILVATPAIIALAGALGALGSSLTFAVGGAGVLGGGMLAALATGIGSTVAVSKSALAPLKDYRKAVEDLNKAQSSGDPRKIQQAADAVNSLAKASPGLAAFSSELDKTQKAFKNAVGNQGRQSFYDFATKGLRTARGALREFREDMNKNAAATFKAFDPLLNFLRGDQFTRFMHSLSRSWRRDIGPVMRGLTGFMSGLVSIFQSSLPYVDRAARSFQRMGESFSSRSARNSERWVKNMIDSFHAWGGLIKSTGRLLAALFAPARQSGDSLVGSLAGTFDKWTKWLNENPDKVRKFFADAVEDTRKLASALAEVVGQLFQIFQQMRPLTGLLTGVLKLAGGGGLLGAAGGYALIRGGLAARKAGAAGAAGAGAAGVVAGGAGAVGRTIPPPPGASRLSRFRYGARQLGAGATRAAPLVGAGLIASQVGGNLTEQATGSSTAGSVVSSAGTGATIGAGIGSLIPIVGTAAGAGIGAVAGGIVGFISSKSAPKVDPSIAAKAAASVGRLNASRVMAGGSIGDAQRRRTDIQETLNAGRFVNRGTPAQEAALDNLRARAQQVRLAGGSKMEVDIAEAAAKGMEMKIHPKLTAADKARLKAELESINPNVLRRNRSREHATQLNSEFQQGFRQLRGQGASASDAFERTTQSAMQTMGRISTATGKAKFADEYLQWAKQVQEQNPKIKGQVDDLTSTISRRLRRMGENSRVVGGKVVQNLSGAWSQLNKELHSKNEQLLQDFSNTLTATQRKALAILRAMGLSPGAATAVMQGTTTVGDVEAGERGSRNTGGRSRTAANRASGAAPQAARAHGGRVPGVGVQDKVAMGGAMVAPGELVANRHTEAKVNRLLSPYGETLGGIVANERRPHGEVPERLATGGRPADRHRRSNRNSAGPTTAPGQARPGLQPGINSATNQVLSKFPGLTVTSTTGGTHAAGSYHYKGQAVDIGGPPELMNQAAKWIGRRLGASLAEGIHNPGLSVKSGKNVPSSFWGADTWAGHADHIHMAIAGALAGGAAGGRMTGGGGGGMTPFEAPPTIPMPRLADRSGVQAVAAQQGVAAQRKRANRLIYKEARRRWREENANAGGGGGGGEAGMGNYGGGGNLRRWLTRALRITNHYNASNLAGLTRMAMGESSGDPNARQQIIDVNSTNGSGGAMGLLQTIPATFNAYKLPGHNNIFNPVDNAIASIRYQFARYGRIVGHPGYAHGGRLPGNSGAEAQFGGWFGDGGSVTTDRPTFIGIGERGGSETATVTVDKPGKKGGGSGIHIDHLVIHGGEDTKNEVLKAFEELINQLDRGD